MQLSTEEREWAAGHAGDALRMATRILADMGGVLGADRLVPIRSAHIDGCLYHGDAGVHFAEALARGGGRVRVPTTLNVGAIDLLHPGAIRLEGHERSMAQRLMDAYVDMGCAQTWTCAPYQAGHRPGLGEDVAWAESNAVVFANTVLGARTNRYGDFLDICAALTGRVPRCGLHVDENRRATIVVRTGTLSERLKRQSSFYPALGAWLGRVVGSEIAVIDGLPSDTSEDALKAAGAASASTGAVGLFHVAGVTPEAPTVEAACGGEPPTREIELDLAMVRDARDRLSTTSSDAVDVIALGSPHYSLAEFETFERLLAGRRLALPVTICTGRHTIPELDRSGAAARLAAAGVEIITDTCIVVTPILDPRGGVLMTDSGKFAHYAVPNIGYQVVFGSVADCVETAVAGRLVRDEESWR